MPIEARGRKDPALAARMRGEVVDEPQVWDYYVGRRPLKVGKETRMPGEPLPEAETFDRLESWINTGAITRLPHGANPPAVRGAAARKPAEKAPAVPQPAADGPKVPRRRKKAVVVPKHLRERSPA